MSVVAEPSEPRQARSAVGELRRVVAEHPLLVVGAVAMVARVVVVVLAELVVSDTIVPDEWQYLEIAARVADGRGAGTFFSGYGQQLYESTWAFTAPLARGVELLGVSYLPGRLIAAVAGALAAIVVAGIVRRLAPRAALPAGLLVALLPSQVFWSASGIRESVVWLGMALVVAAVAVMFDAERRALWAAVAAAAAGLAIVGLTRDQTQVVVAWAIVPAVLFAAADRRLRLAALGLLLAVVVPWATGAGPGGWDLAVRAIPRLGQLRTYGAMEAESAFVATTTIPPDLGSIHDPPAFRGPGGVIRPGGGGGPRGATGPRDTRPGASTTTSIFLAPGAPEPGKACGEDDDVHDVGGYADTVYCVEETANASLRQIPRGVVATTLRPFPWESTGSTSMKIARAETILWWALYVLAITGAVLQRRRLQLVAFPVIVILGLILTGAVSQGNLGTAFRHRGQLVGPLAILAALGMTALAERRRIRANAS